MWALLVLLSHMKVTLQHLGCLLSRQHRVQSNELMWHLHGRSGGGKGQDLSSHIPIPVDSTFYTWCFSNTHLHSASTWSGATGTAPERPWLLVSSSSDSGFQICSLLAPPELLITGVYPQKASRTTVPADSMFTLTQHHLHLPIPSSAGALPASVLLQVLAA